MAERDALKKLTDDGAVATSLRKGSSSSHAITALQMPKAIAQSENTRQT